MKFNKIIIGALPEPIGGVSFFLYRFAIRCMDEKDLFLDLYKTNNKYFVPDLRVRSSPFNNWFLRYIFIVANLIFNSGRVVHFHFSGIKSCYAFLLIPKKNERWVLTLHSGTVDKASHSLGRVRAFFLKKALGKFEIIHAISEQQAAFYLDYVSSQKIIVAPTYIPPSSTLLSHASVDNSVIQNRISEIKDKGGYIVMTSGYPSCIYNFDKFKAGVLAMGPDYYGVVVVYGPRSEEYVSRQSKCSSDDRVLWFSSLAQPQFLRLQKEIDCYVRLTESDSFGIAVADSIELGTPALATDVCKRYPGTVTISIHDVEHWTRYLPVKTDSNFDGGSWSFLSVIDELYE